MAIEAIHVYKWLKSQLSDASIASAGSLGLFANQAPLGVKPPFVLYSLQSGIDVFGSPGIRLLTNNLYWVRAVGYSETETQLLGIADACDTMLEHQSGPVPSDTINVFLCNRMQPLALTQTTDNIQWSYIGGLYRIYAI